MIRSLSAETGDTVGTPVADPAASEIERINLDDDDDDDIEAALEAVDLDEDLAGDLDDLDDALDDLDDEGLRDYLTDARLEDSGLDVDDPINLDALNLDDDDDDDDENDLAQTVSELGSEVATRI